MDIQHSMAVKIAAWIDGKEIKEETERICLIYGIEVFLNEFLKIAVSWMIAMVLGVFPLVVFGTVYLLLLRRYAGGRHFESNVACFIFSIFTLVIVPFAGLKIDFPLVVQIGSVLIEIILFFIYAPSKVTISILERDRWRRKIKTLAVYLIGLFLSWIIGKESYVNVMLLMGLIVAIATIEKRR